MLWTLAVAAGAEEPIPALDGWERVPDVARPAWITGTVWLRDADACVPAKVEDAARGRLAARVCAQGEVTCDVVVSLEAGLEVTAERCRAGGPRGDEIIGSAPLSRTHATPLTLVRADGEVAAYRAAVPLQVAVPVRSLARAPCTRDSLRALERQAKAAAGRDGVAGWLAERGIEGGERTCDRTEAFVVEPVPIGHAGTPTGVGTGHSPVPVDCAVPCPDNPVLAEIARAEAAVAGAVFAHRDDPPVTIHRTEAGCRAAPPGPAVLPVEVCERLGPSLTPR